MFSGWTGQVTVNYPWRILGTMRKPMSRYLFVCGEAQTMEQSMLLFLFLLFFFLWVLL